MPSASKQHPRDQGAGAHLEPVGQPRGHLADPLAGAVAVPLPHGERDQPAPSGVFRTCQLLGSTNPSRPSDGRSGRLEEVAQVAQAADVTTDTTSGSPSASLGRAGWWTAIRRTRAGRG